MIRCGLDEAGRGPLAGPVCAASVILSKDFPFEILKDSKKLSEKNREAARIIICERAVAWGIGWASAAEIDAINILKASLLAMERAYAAMLEAAQRSGVALECSEAIVDGLYTPIIPIPCTPMVKADALIPEVMAASILAKTARDRMMERYGWIYPEYGFEQHKGYRTRLHRERILQYGPSPIQRYSFSIGPELDFGN